MPMPANQSRPDNSQTEAAQKAIAIKADVLWLLLNNYRGKKTDFRFSAEFEYQWDADLPLSIVSDVDLRVFEGTLDRFWRPNIWGTGRYREHATAFTIGPRIYFLRRVFPQFALQGVFVEPGLSVESKLGTIYSPLVVDVEEKYQKWYLNWKAKVGFQGQLFPRLLVSASVEFFNRRFPAEGGHRYTLLPEINIAYRIK
jgi:hypothetical protein